VIQPQTQILPQIAGIPGKPKIANDFYRLIKLHQVKVA
jgi:hypothetical protein